MPSKGRTLTAEEKDQFAYEVALGYFTDDELRRRFKLQPAAYDYIKGSASMQLRILDKLRVLDESDFALKVHARRAARVALGEYIKIVKDDEAPAKTRMEAGRQIREIARGVDKDVLAADVSEGMLVLKTNLDLEGAKGVYAITADEIETQLEENDRLKAEMAERAEAEVDAETEQENELMRLLGI